MNYTARRARPVMDISKAVWQILMGTGLKLQNSKG
jgi:hypothetical protein